MNARPPIAISRVAGFVCFVLAGVVAIFAIRLWMEGSNGWFWPGTFLVVAAGFLRAGYLALFHWSALALRHVVGALFFLFTVWILRSARFPDQWILLPICYLVYRYAAFALARYAFPASVPVPAAGQGDGC